MARATRPLAASRRRKPVWREVEERESRRLSNRARAASRRRRRIAVVYDIEGPRVRLGIGWFVLLLVSLSAGLAVVTAVYAAAAALAATQVARTWWRRGGGNRPNVSVATIGAPALVVAAAISTAMLGIAILGLVITSIVTASSDRRTAPIVGAARTLQCAVWAGGAAASVVCTYRFEIGAAVALVLVVSAYETGDYLIGTGGRSALEGPIAGAAAVLVVQFGIAAIGVPPFELPGGLGFAVLAAVLCPLGQLVASLVLPSAKAPAPALRRLDSLLLLGPVWALLTGIAAS